MLVFVAQVSRVYPLEASVIMSYTSRHVLSASVNKQNKTKQKPLIYDLYVCPPVAVMMGKEKEDIPCKPKSLIHYNPFHFDPDWKDAGKQYRSNIGLSSWKAGIVMFSTFIEAKWAPYQCVNEDNCQTQNIFNINDTESVTKPGTSTLCAIEDRSLTKNVFHMFDNDGVTRDGRRLRS